MINGSFQIAKSTHIGTNKLQLLAKLNKEALKAANILQGRNQS
jgi:hypothetical protein